MTLLPISVLQKHNQGLFIGRSIFCRVSARQHTDTRSDVLKEKKNCRWVIGGGDEINTVLRAEISRRSGSLRGQKFLKQIFFSPSNRSFVQTSRLTKKIKIKINTLTRPRRSGASSRPAALSFSCRCRGSSEWRAFPTLCDAARHGWEIDFSTRSRKKEMTARQIKFFVPPFIGTSVSPHFFFFCVSPPRRLICQQTKTPVRANLSAEAEQQQQKLGGGY